MSLFNTADAVALWLRQAGFEVDDVHTRGRVGGIQFRVGLDRDAEKDVRDLRAFVEDIGQVSVDLGQHYTTREFLAEQLQITEDDLGECSHQDCGEDADKWVVLSGFGLTRDYCEHHASRSMSYFFGGPEEADATN